MYDVHTSYPADPRLCTAIKVFANRLPFTCDFHLPQPAPFPVIMSSEWYRWEQVAKYVSSGHKLYRSSTPNYAGLDLSQNLTPTAVQFLTEKGIDNIISFNQYSYTDDERKLLADAKTSYLHLPVVDFNAPTLEQLESAITFFNDAAHKSTLVHCGYGHGRSGTGVTGLQLNATRGENPPEADWKTVNHVEDPTQIAVLRTLRDKLKES